MPITRSSTDTVKGPADWSTGDVHIDAVARFLPGARTHWHRHR